MWFSEYLFLERSWAKDESTLKVLFHYMCSTNIHIAHSIMSSCRPLPLTLFSLKHILEVEISAHIHMNDLIRVVSYL